MSELPSRAKLKAVIDESNAYTYKMFDEITRLNERIDILVKENEKMKKQVAELLTKRAKVEKEITDKFLGGLTKLIEGMKDG